MVFSFSQEKKCIMELFTMGWFVTRDITQSVKVINFESVYKIVINIFTTSPSSPLLHHRLSMSITPSTLRSQLALRLSDQFNLLYDADTMGEALCAMLAELSRVFSADLFISGVDESPETTLPEPFVHPLLVGAVAFALRFRAAGQF
jgi:hypothetical protein